MVDKEDCWMQTHSGVAFNLVEPIPEMVNLGDIVWALSRIARYNGHTDGRYTFSVAQHSMLVEFLMPEDASPMERLYALLHDAHEAYTGDFITPMKRALQWMHENTINARGPSCTDMFDHITKAIDVCVWTALGITSPKGTWRDRVTHADLQALVAERDILLGPPPKEWGSLPPAPELTTEQIDRYLRPLKPTDAYIAFLDRYAELDRRRHKLDH